MSELLGEERLLWGVPAIAEEIDRTPRQTWHLLNSGLLPAKKVGAKWVATRGGLRDFFAKATAASPEPGVRQ